MDATSSTSSPPRLAALIPAYREASSISDVVRRTLPHVDLVLVVDDGSPDDSAALAKQAGAEVIQHTVNQGKGAAIKTGMKALCERGVEFIMLLDGDGQHAPEEIPRFSEAAKCSTAGIVIGNRFENVEGMPFVRRSVNAFMSYMISNACGVKIPDTQCGFRLVRSSIVPSIMGSSDHFDFETEMLLLASRSGLTIKNVPVSTIYGEETSKIQPVRDTIKFFKLMRRYAKSPPVPVQATAEVNRS
jgi:glycosyltransferase involved in cell wall biosynthesis